MKLLGVLQHSGYSIWGQSLHSAKGIAQNMSVPRRNQTLDASNADVGGDCANTPDATLREVITGCQHGDRIAQRQLYDLCHRNVFRLTVRMVGNEDAGDVTQQVFLQAFRAIGQFKGDSQFDTWLYRLTVNESLQHLRRRKRWQSRVLEQEPMDESPDHEKETEHKELLEQAMARLDPELRSIFALREIEGLSYQQIAETMEIPEGTVASRLNRARRELKEHLTDLDWEP